MMVAGHLNDTSLLAAIGMGNTIQNCFFVSPIYGLNSAIETLASQAAGAKNVKLAGVYHNRGKVVLVGLFVFLVIIGLQTKTILITLRQNESVAEYTH